MKIHEFQAKDLLRNAGIPVPKGNVAATSEEAVEVAKTLDGPLWVVKAQIHAGGRGKGGGVKKRLRIFFPSPLLPIRLVQPDNRCGIF